MILIIHQSTHKTGLKRKAHLEIRPRQRIERATDQAHVPMPCIDSIYYWHIPNRCLYLSSQANVPLEPFLLVSSFDSDEAGASIERVL